MGLELDIVRRKEAVEERYLFVKKIEDVFPRKRADNSTVQAGLVASQTFPEHMINFIDILHSVVILFKNAGRSRFCNGRTGGADVSTT